ncbi:isochorismatase family protein, partial [Rhizobium ruizarguesonis]
EASKDSLSGPRFAERHHIGNDAFELRRIPPRLQGSETDKLIFSGVENDVCVYASVLDAVDAGYRVILAKDAVASGDMK